MSIVFEETLPIGSFVIYDQKPNIDFIEVKQVHGNTVLEKSDVRNGKSEADGIYCLNEEYQNLAIKTADCLPICVLGEKGVAMLHAGWRGIDTNIFSPFNLNKIAPFHFYIGPGISVDHYEVQPDFQANFRELENCFIHRDNRLFFDLKLAAKTLISHQFPAATIEITQIDTFTSPELHSYRKNKTEQRNWNLWVLERPNA